MAEKMCLQHEQNRATAHCFQCHKPLCQQCVMVTPHGSFCSTACSMTYKEMKAHLKDVEPPRKGSLLGTLVRLVILAAVVIVGIHLCVRYGIVGALKPIDLIGKMTGFVP
jgi:hypothetical protein